MPQSFDHLIQDEINSYKSLAQNLSADLVVQINRAVAIMHATIKSGGCIYFCGNGGSCSQSEHLAAELMGRYSKPRIPIKAVSLSTNMSVISCIGNDFGFDKIFSRQIHALGTNKDCIVMLSTSGLSANIVDVAKTAHSLDIKRILLTGSLIEKLGVDAEVIIKVASNDTARVQEQHLLIGHILCKCLENEFDQ